MMHVGKKFQDCQNDETHDSFFENNSVLIGKIPIGMIVVFFSSSIKANELNVKY